MAVALKLPVPLDPLEMIPMDKPDPRAFADIEDYFAALDEFYAAELYADLIPTAA